MTTKNEMTREEQNEQLNQQGLAGYDQKFTLNFRVAKKRFFKVTYGSIDSLNQAPYFATSAEKLNHNRTDIETGGQAQKEVLPAGLSRKFYKKWDKYHLQALTLDQMKELKADLKELEARYPYVITGYFGDEVYLDRRYSNLESANLKTVGKELLAVLDEFLEVEYIGIKKEQNGATTHTFNNYNVTITHNDKSETFNYFAGMMLGEPTASDVMYSLISDMDYNSMEILIDELAYSYKKAKELFEGINANNEKLNNLFTARELKALKRALEDF